MEHLKKVEISDELDDVVREIKDLQVECPECAGIDDDQYACGTCEGQGGQGMINVYRFITQTMFNAHK